MSITGKSHASAGRLAHARTGVLSVVGRNGMGKTTLCNAIVGLMPVRSGDDPCSKGENSSASSRTDRPRRRRLRPAGAPPAGRAFRSTRHLRLENARAKGAWTVERIYSTFPRLAERRGNGGGQLSGGEQQMLAIARALLGNPAPSGDGRADRRSGADDRRSGARASASVSPTRRNIAVLLVEQNIGVATSVSDHVAIMVNGRVNRIMDASALAADRDLQQRLLGVGRHGQDETDGAAALASACIDAPVRRDAGRSRCAAATRKATTTPPVYRADHLPNRWGLRPSAPAVAASAPQPPLAEPRPLLPLPFAERIGRTALVVGTFDTKGAELRFIRDRLRATACPCARSISRRPESRRAPTSPRRQVAAMHPGGSAAVFSGDRGASVAAMAEAFARWIDRERGIGGVISAGGSGGTTLATAGMRRLPLGVPKIMVSTVASGQVAALCRRRRHHDDAFGRRRSGRERDHRAGARQRGACARGHDRRKPVTGGAGGPAPARAARGRHDDVRRHDARRAGRSPGASKPTSIVWCSTRPGAGGRSMESLANSALLAGFIDLTTTEVADMTGRRRLPLRRRPLRRCDPHAACPMSARSARWIWSTSGPATPCRTSSAIAGSSFTTRTSRLMRTTPEENRAVGEWIGERMNQMEGPVRLLLPEGGVSALDAPGKPFHDPEADAALFDALERTVRQTPRRRIERVKANINDRCFHRCDDGGVPRLSARAENGEPDAPLRTPGYPRQVRTR